ncbi:adenine phosphoribosyltransferase [bacterium]|nr:MAG: adenine phosphoribosyltransferase [bacterium]
MNFEAYLRRVPEFPRPGITFIDVMPLLSDALALRAAIDALCAMVADVKVDRVVAPEARGFLLGAPLAYALGVGFTPARKPGRLPADAIRSTYQLEYGEDALEMHRDGIRASERVLLVDDLLATGGTVKAAADLVERLGGHVVAAVFLVELTDLGGRSGLLRQYSVKSLIQTQEAASVR